MAHGSAALALELDGRNITAQPRPEDQDRLVGLLAGRQSVALAESDAEADTTGHALATDVTVDVEGHALTLRLPSQADAEALRRALAVGAVTATLVAAGAIAAMQGAGAPTQDQVVAPGAPVAPPAQTLAERREARFEQMNSNVAAPVDSNVAAPAGPGQVMDQEPTNQRRSGPLE